MNKFAIAFGFRGKIYKDILKAWEILERETNTGSYLSVSRGLDWVFERVEETIILEDDTVPDPSFFRFASELLEKYWDHLDIGSISGDNYDDPRDWPGPESYRFTRYHHAGGWATWARAVSSLAAF